MMIKSAMGSFLALGLGALAGCGNAQLGAPAGPGAAGAGAPIPVSYDHAAVNTPVSLNLKDYRYYPQGSGIEQNAQQVGNQDLSVDYTLALRTAAIKLRGDLPTMAELRRLQAAVAVGASDGSENDPGHVYADLVTGYVNAPTFARQMVVFWRNTLRMGGPPIQGQLQDLPISPNNLRSVSLETGPAFMARLTVNGADMRRAFTEPGNACPVFNPATNTFTSDPNDRCYMGDVNNAMSLSPSGFPGNGVPEGSQAGILTNPGFMAQYYSNMGFRRARLINELFHCDRLPSEFAAMPQTINSILYSSPWPLDVVPSSRPNKAPTLATRRYRDPSAPQGTEFVDFQVACQNCHGTQNHRASLFAVFDQAGFMSPKNWLTVTDPTKWATDLKFMVVTPVSNSPFTQLNEYIFPGDTPAWVFGQPATNFQQFGTLMGNDPAVQRCFMTRIWNNAYSRDDVVNDLALVPAAVTDELLKYFQQNNFNLKATILKMYTDPNFIRF